jgi:hypothetical protein
MSDGVKKYIMISGTILLILLCAGICWLVKFMPLFVFTFAYMIGLANGMLILGILNRDD